MATIARVQAPFLQQHILKSFQDQIQAGNLSFIAKKNLNQMLPNGYLPLHFAVLEGQTESVQKLLESGADLSQKDTQGLTALEHAVYQKKPEILKLLIQHKIKNATPDQIQTELAKANVQAQTLDPLRLADVQKLFFGITIFISLVPLLASAGWMDAELQEIIVGINSHFWQTAVFLSQTHLGDMKSFITSALAAAGSQFYPSLGLFIQAIATCSLTHSAWQGMKNAWSQARYRPWASLGYVAVHVTNLAGTGYSLFKNLRSYATTSRSMEAPKPNFKVGVNLALVTTCSETSLDQLLSVNSRNSAEIQAALGISSLDPKALKSAYRSLSTWVHPDKCPKHLQEKSNEAFRHLQTLFDSLTSQCQGMDAQQVIKLKELSEKIREMSSLSESLLEILQSRREELQNRHDAIQQECRDKPLSCLMQKEREPAYQKAQQNLETTSQEAIRCNAKLSQLSEEYRKLLDKKHS